MKKKTWVGVFMLGIAIVAPARQPEIDMNTILKNSAEYCERLKIAAFHFICLENVKETIKDQKGNRDKTTFLYDYQLFGRDGNAEESRTLKQIDGVSQPAQKNARLGTEFYSQWSVYAPIFLLARENQEKFRYQIIKKERIKGIKTWVLDVEPLVDKGIIIHGRIWLDQKDFSVLCIEINPGALGGYQKQLENARSLGAKLWLTDTHWYEVRHDGLRFPSRTEFYERYHFDGKRIFNNLHSTTRGSITTGWGPEGVLTSPEISTRSAFSSEISTEAASSISGQNGWVWDRSETSFTYNHYYFFQVRMDIKEHLPEN